ncbi:MAG TPA: sulfotransferase [Steroidobacteraceae bacterium]|nr:sulfotransferase [Steroidobacteraceae bacterium]
MLSKFFTAKRAVEVGTALADEFVASGPAAPSSAVPPTQRPGQPQQRLQAFFQSIDREARPLQLGLYGRSRLVHSFKWKLLEKGIAAETVDRLTQMLILRLAGEETEAQPAAEASEARTDRKHTSPRKAEALLAQADGYVTQNDYAQAAALYMQAIELNPRHANARIMLGAMLCKLGRYAEAEEHFRRAAVLNPRSPDAHSNVGTVLLWRGQVSEAEAPLRRALKLSPKHLDAQVSLGRTLLALGRVHEAKEAFRKALAVAPMNIHALMGLGDIAAAEGRMEEAETLFKRASELQPRSAGAWASLAALRKMTRLDAAWLQEAESIAGSSVAPFEEAKLRFAIGKYYDDIGEFAQAFRSYERANELHKLAAAPYRKDLRTAFVDDITRTYTRERLSRAHPGSSDSAKPVFVVGMMRSGTSLVEQIIASHPAAAGAGEMPFWSDAVRKRQPAAQRELLSEQTRGQLSDAYLKILDRCSSGALRVVDKTAINLDYLGIIHTTFPRARMIHVQRNPIDTCLSCFFQELSPALTFTMDLSDLSHYYRENHRLISHWRTVLPPETLLIVPYEDLVSDAEGWSRRIIDFLGLEWDPRCLEFGKTDRPVLTASRWQVRQKIYTSSVERWRPYKRFIGPLLGLEDLRL